MSPEFNTRSKFKKENGFSATILYENRGSEVYIERIDTYGLDLNLERHSNLIETFSKQLENVCLLSINAEDKSLKRILEHSDDWVPELFSNTYKKIL